MTDKSGAKAALKGYRLQTLFIMDAILNQTNENLTFQPEGHEDLAVYQDDRLIQVVQIKAHSKPLTISSFNPQSEDSFFHRVAALLQHNTDLKIIVASYGEIGSEITNSWADPRRNNDIQTKLLKHGIKAAQVTQLFSHVTWLAIKEEDMLQRCYKCLNKTLTAGAPDNAISLLTAWLYHASEHKTKISPRDLMAKIAATGKYLAEREAHHGHWFKSITPLTAGAPINKERLASEYYKGVSTRFSHIEAELDVHRTTLLSAIDEYFEQNQTVIIHGASGQGKTSLAYRYLYNYVPEDWRLQINFVEDRHHAKSVALAIADHIAVFNATLYLYIDVTPRDYDWTALVQSLLDKPNIKILVTIRAEDLARQNVGNDTLGLPATLALEFSKNEAQYIYQNLIKKDITSKYPSFELAWLGFGGGGALLEYVYFLTQTESLKEKLTAQVRVIQTEIRANKLEAKAATLLLSCAVATAYEAKVSINLLVDEIGLNDPRGTFELFENEYLVRRSKDQLYVEALHPIRSKILVDILTDPAFSPWLKAALAIIPCIEESDIEGFLLYSFIEHAEHFEPLFHSLNILKIKTWVGAAGICRALLWYGIHCHVVDNKKAIDDAIAFAGNSGWGELKGDVAGILDIDPADEIIRIKGQNNPKELANAQSIRRQFTSNGKIYAYLKQWLRNFDCNIAQPTDSANYRGYAEVLFWLGWHKINKKVDAFWLEDLDIISDFTAIEPVAELTLGLWYFDKNIYQQFMAKNKVTIMSLFQRATNTVWLEHRPISAVAHYIIPVKHIGVNTVASELNELAVSRARLLRQILPTQAKLGAKGYGHKVVDIALPLDESTKTGIDKSALPAQQMIKINSTWSNYAQYDKRPNDWSIYAREILDVRRQFVDGLSLLNKKLIKYFNKKIAKSLILGDTERAYWTGLGRLNMHLSRLPKLAVDPWGYTSEATVNTEGKKDDDQQISNLLSTQKHYTNYCLTLTEYVESIALFFHHCADFLVLHGIIGRATPAQIQQQLQWAADSGQPYSEDSLTISITKLMNACNQIDEMQQQFRSQFSNLVDIDALKSLEQLEKHRLVKAWPLWFQFARHPEKYWKDSPDTKAASIVSNTINALITAFELQLTTALPSHFAATILSSNYKYDGEKALWVGVELATLDAYKTCMASIVEVLSNVIGPLDGNELNCFALTNQWANLIIIPLVNGRTIGHSSWVFLMTAFVGDQPVIDESKPWLYSRSAIEQQALEHFGFEENNTYRSKALAGVTSELNKVGLTVNHVHCFCDLAPNINAVGFEILEQHLSKLMPALAENIACLKEKISELSAIIDNSERAIALSHQLAIVESAIAPYEQTDGDISLHFFEIWARMVNNALSELDLYQWRSCFY